MMLREPWRTRLLFLSFAVNLITIPIAAAPYVISHPLPPMPAVPGGPGRPVVMFDRIAKSLSDEDHEKFIGVVEPHYEEIDVARARMEAARAAMLRAIGRTPYDPETLRTAMRAWQVAWKAWSDDFGGAFLEAVGEISPDGRQRLAEFGRRRPRP